MRRKLVSNNHPLYEVINRGHCLSGVDQLATDRYICVFIVKAREKTVISAPRPWSAHKADVDGLLCRQTWLKHGAYPAHFGTALTSSWREKIEEKQEQKALISMAAKAQHFNNDTRYTEVTASAMNRLTACSILRLAGAIFEHVTDSNVHWKAKSGACWGFYIRHKHYSLNINTAL